MPNPVPGTVVPTGALVSPGGTQGAGGPMGPNGPTVVSADAGNIATLGSDNLILVPQSSLWNMRLRSFNAVGNPSFEVDQRNVGNQLANPANGTFVQDRWRVIKSGTMGIATQQFASGSGLLVPGTNFRISGNFLMLTLTAQEASLAAGDYFSVHQFIEGPMARELANDVSSVSLLIWCSVVPLKFGLSLRDSANGYSICKLCTISAAGWNLIQLPNIPAFPAAGTFPIAPGNVGYTLAITFAAGSSFMPPANDVWQSGNFLGAVGQDNFASKPITSSTIQIAFIQHEPGPQCTTLIDKPFTQNLDECLRYFDKSYDYGTALGTVVTNGAVAGWQQSTTLIASGLRFKKRMAKVPTAIAIYNSTTGASNSINFGGSNYAVSAINSYGESGFVNFTAATMPAVVAGATCQFHYTADTGW